MCLIDIFLNDSSKTEVCDLDLIVFPNQNIGCTKVAVYKVLGLQICHAISDLEMNQMFAKNTKDIEYSLNLTLLAPLVEHFFVNPGHFDLCSEESGMLDCQSQDTKVRAFLTTPFILKII
ncbi:hypothetical protein DPMN_064116 [Dreissena polymorpha]|uniref:Uncharacterized protein n=1 Tax=Dreissena polymorpha TaxID=45954 RepID=A0A9D4CBQ2_DREPO|nr:hypothetical protein DPMN_064116 [Dreissena polymorpha]